MYTMRRWTWDISHMVCKRCCEHQVYKEALESEELTSSILGLLLCSFVCAIFSLVFLASIGYGPTHACWLIREVIVFGATWSLLELGGSGGLDWRTWRVSQG